MFIIEAMMNDHENIRRMMKVMRAIDNDIKNGNVIEVEDVERIIDFLRVYGDEHHHHKEEVILFPAMLETIPMTDGMINGVMLVEHEGGREYVSDLESALLDYKKDPNDNNASRICFASEGYINLLSDHTSKEDEILYQVAENNLPADTKERVDALGHEWEERSIANGIYDKYLGVLEELEARYLF
ncbi:hemerythrin domain-containing protein [Sharpea porci]|uniref:hemerythrin domain-containing protein n=1 Tax=Sharpea porci TaxID=2652286 RepID=UPI002A917CC2|nr:hemerythrin domain-containing protein [Sharpea porci]MDY5278419.1 hemerythrin domain-containing protein [Sharpea porci]